MPSRTTVTQGPLFPPFRSLLVGFGLLAGLAVLQPAYAWTPGTGEPEAAEGFVVDTSDRRDVLAFYNTVYSASEDYADHVDWIGDVDAGIAGTTGFDFKEDVRRRINLYRALVGLAADITFDDSKSAKSQEAALMMAANDRLSHNPTTSWEHYTADGAEAASKGNLFLGRYGPPAIDGYIVDFGDNNKPVGHRRWLLYPRARIMGTGDIPSGSSHRAANTVWVIGDFKPPPTPEFTVWPNEGYSPHTLMPDRWSLSYPGASFTSATVSMGQGGQSVPLTVVSRKRGPGDNTIVWEPDGLPASLDSDLTYTITVAGIQGAGIPESHAYSVTLFNPGVLRDEVVISGPESPPISGASYTFNAIDQADLYELRISRVSDAFWTEGAEDTPVGQIVDKTGAAYPLRQGDVKRSGSQAFHLTLPEFVEQAFWIDREIVPSSASQLIFYDLGRFATETTTLSAEVSQDGGLTWSELWNRNGVGLNSSLWDDDFIRREIDLGAFDGQTILIRFIIRWNGASASINATTDAGFFIDDISVTSAEELVATTTTELSGGATSFDLDATTAGAALENGTDYHARIRPKVGTRWFADGPTLVITPTDNPDPVPALSLSPTNTSHGADAVSGQSFSVSSNVAWTATSDAGWITLETTSGKNDGSITYALSANAGTDTREEAITVIGGGLTQTFTVEQAGATEDSESWHAGSDDLGGGWRWFDWLESFNVGQDPWIFHNEHGWLFRVGDDPAAGMYFFDLGQASFFYTTNDIYPMMYRFSDNKWVFYDRGSSNPRWFVDLLTGDWESVE